MALNVLFLCTHNSARSIMAEAILNGIAAPRFRGFSAGSYPATNPNPLAISTLQRSGYSTSDLRSKGWEEFAKPGAPEMDFVITVCDNAAGEACPVWPGRPATAHWGLPDPVFATSDAEIDARIADVAQTLGVRIGLLVSLPVDKLDRLSLQARMRDLGHRPANVA